MGRRSAVVTTGLMTLALPEEAAMRPAPLRLEEESRFPYSRKVCEAVLSHLDEQRSVPLAPLDAVAVKALEQPPLPPRLGAGNRVHSKKALKPPASPSMAIPRRAGWLMQVE